MNIFAVIILSALVGEYILDLVSGVLNLRTLNAPLPAEFEGFASPEAYRKSQEYTRVRTKFGFVTSAWGLLLVTGFWFAGGFNRLDEFVRGLELHPVWSGLCYIGILGLARGILGLPFSLYSTFVIEERFGFNKTTPATYAADLLKGLVLAVLLGGPLLAGVIALFQYAGSPAWLYAWIAVSVYTLVVQFVAPRWIMPIFNKFTPLDPGELRETILSLARSADFSLENVYVMDGSRRSSKTNAFFTGFGKHKRIALFDTLVERHTIPELVSVLAHEIGHYKRKHIIKGMLMSIAHAGILLYLMSVFIHMRGLFDAFSMESMSVYAGLVFFGMLYNPIEVVLSIFFHLISRKHEFEADRFAADVTRQPEAMVTALKKLSIDNLSHLTPHPVHVFLNYSHPPVLERIRALREKPAR